MSTSDPTNLQHGTRERRCFECSAWVEPEKWPATAQPLGDCTVVRWMLRGHRQMTHADDVCAKFEPSMGRSVDEREVRAVGAGLG